ncbi:hypothetical protein LTR95_008658 [Oleoguttula sp. CCFEE 5521]
MDVTTPEAITGGVPEHWSFKSVVDFHPWAVSAPVEASDDFRQPMRLVSDAVRCGHGAGTCWTTELRLKGTSDERSTKKTVKSKQARVEEELPSSKGARVDWSERQPLPEYADAERNATNDEETPAGELKEPATAYEHPRTTREKVAANLARKEKGDDLSWQVADDLKTPITRAERLEAEKYQAAGRAAAATGEAGTARKGLSLENRRMISKAAVHYRYAWVRGKDAVLMRALQVANEELEEKGYGPRGTVKHSVLLSPKLLDVIVLVTEKLDEWWSLVQNGQNSDKAAIDVVWAVQRSRTHLESMELKWRQVVHSDFVDRLWRCFVQGLALQPDEADALQTVVDLGATKTQLDLLERSEVKKQLTSLASPDSNDSDERHETANMLVRTNQNMKGQNKIDNLDENDHIIPDVMIERLLVAQPGDRQGVLRDICHVLHHFGFGDMGPLDSAGEDGDIWNYESPAAFPNLPHLARAAPLTAILGAVEVDMMGSGSAIDELSAEQEPSTTGYAQQTTGIIEGDATASGSSPMASRADPGPIDRPSGKFTPVGILDVGRMMRYIVNVGGTERGQEVFEAWTAVQCGNINCKEVFAGQTLNKIRYTEKLSPENVIVDGICCVMTKRSPRTETSLRERRAKVEQRNEGEEDLDLIVQKVPRPPTYFRIQYERGGTRIEGWMVRTDLIRAIGRRNVDGREADGTNADGEKAHVHRLMAQHEALKAALRKK